MSRKILIRNKVLEITKDVYYGWGIGIISGDGDGDYPNCHINIKLRKFFISINVPHIIKPKAKIVFANWDLVTEKRLGRNHYFNYTPREYSISLFENHLNIYYGLSSGDSNTEQRCGWFLPWNEYRHVCHNIYDDKGFLFHNYINLMSYDDSQLMIDKCPKKKFILKDYDGEIVTATTYIEQREWERGTGWFKWLGDMFPTKVRRSLCIEFDKEVGPKKGSWKGGILGTGIELDRRIPAELHRSGMNRYCKENNMSFVGWED